MFYPEILLTKKNKTVKMSGDDTGTVKFKLLQCFSYKWILVVIRTWRRFAIFSDIHNAKQ